MIDRIEVLDDYTLKVHYKDVFAPGLSSWTMPIIPKHLLEGRSLLNTRFSRHPVGTGPYRFRLWKAQEKIVLESNKNYFEGKPILDYVVLRVLQDTATTFLELLAQGVDYASLTPLQYRFQATGSIFRRNFRRFKMPSRSYVYMGYNLRNSLFKDVRVRQALSMAVDKKKIIKAVLLGEGLESTGPFTPTQWAYNPEVKPFLYSPQRAREILHECGWEDKDGDGILEKDGRKFEFTVITNQGNLERQRVLELIQEDLNKVGVRVKIKVVEWSTFINEFINKRSFEAVLLGWSLGPEPDIFDIFHSSRQREGQFNFVGYSNREVDRLIEEARGTLDRERRRSIYHRLQEIIYQEQPYMFLYVPFDFFALHKRFKNVVLKKAGIFHNFKDWYVPCSQQRYKALFSR